MTIAVDLGRKATKQTNKCMKKIPSVWLPQMMNYWYFNNEKAMQILSFYSLVSSADNLCKQDQARQYVGPDLDPRCLTLMVFLKEFKKK